MEKTATAPTGFSTILEGNKQVTASIKKYEMAPISTKVRNIAFGGMTIGTLILFSVFASSIISGVAALVVTIVGVGGGFLGLRFMRTMDPLIQQKTKNFKIKAMVNEARRNSIAQLDNQVLKNHERLIEARKARDTMGALVEKVKSKINPANEGKPMHTKKVEMLKRVEDSYKMVIENVDKAASVNRNFEQKVLEFKDMESFTELIGQAMNVFDKSGSGKLDQMLSLAAFEQIETDFNGAIISIENSARDMQLDNSDD